ncbi:carboxypeptidase-like regulatory domain-containing protein [Flaviaesturariibacter amylovorans]|uniref:Carboxypeptidase-like regulatory domain-containing protein n=1 Tax=Flaviaesturariibacter amylovorans TaxID=1084520 RepID=A0ABP8HVL4_9BACT
MKKLSFLLLALLCATLSFAQGILTGTVTDADNGQPLEGASVFAQNTTVGTLSKNDGSYRLSLGKGGWELVVSYTGYVSEKINVDPTGDLVRNIALKKEDKSLTEVVIQSTNEVADGLAKYGDFFLAHFLGKTANAAQTKLENPGALRFFYYKRSDKLKVFASEPLRISNNALGYQLQYNLDSFVYYYKTDVNSYRGSCLFMPMDGDATQKAAWETARDAAYRGSRLHFLRAYYDSALKQEGFVVNISLKSNPSQFGMLSNPYDTSYYYTDSAGNVELWFPRKASISYMKAKPEPAYIEEAKLPKDFPAQVTYVDLLDGILIRPNGYFTDQGSWVSQGYWSWKNLADQLPYDYEPRE